MDARRRRARPRRPDAAAATAADIVEGFTLVEASLAIGLCAALAVGLTPVLIRASTAAGTARARATATAAAVERLEQLRALDWAVADDGAGGDIDITDVVTGLDVAPASLAGTGLGASPAGSLLRDMDGWVDYLDQDGRWMGAGGRPPAGALFVRRWNISPLPSAPASALAIQVLVTSLHDEQRLGPRIDLRPRPRDVWLVAVRVRERRP